MDSVISRYFFICFVFYNVIVVKDGFGKYRMVGEVIMKVLKIGDKYVKWYVIYVKVGVYDE